MPATRRYRGRSQRGLAVGILALVSAAVLLGHGLIPNVDGYASLFETFLPWIGIAIAILAILALVRLSAFAGLCVAIAAVIWAVMFVPVMIPANAPGTPSLTIASENVRADNPAAADIAKSLAGHKPDIIALQELDATSRDRISAVLAAQYPHSVIVGTVGVWSREPIIDSQRLELGLGWDRALRLDIDTSGGVTRVYAVHMASVRPGEYEQRNTMLSKLSETIAADTSKRMVVVGDFNSASTDRAFSPLTGIAHEASAGGTGFGFTWPANFPVARLDHALVRGMTTLKSTVLPDNGSDHRGILVSLR